MGCWIFKKEFPHHASSETQWSPISFKCLPMTPEEGDDSPGSYYLQHYRCEPGTKCYFCRCAITQNETARCPLNSVGERSIFTHNSQPVMSPSSLSPSHVLLLLPLHPPPSSQTPPSPAPSTSATLIKFAALTLASGVMSEPETVQSTSTRVKHRDPALY